MYQRAFRCHRRLALPFEYPKVSIDADLSKPLLKIFQNEKVAPVFNDWLSTLGLTCQRWRWFNNPPNTRYQIHVDGDDPPGVEGVFLNFQFGGSESYMKWYEIKPGRHAKKYINGIGASVTKYDEEDVFEIHCARLGFPSMVNATIPHTMINGSTHRQSYSMQINYISGRRLLWDEGVDIFSPYIDGEKT